jgi:hypothetical protein
MRSGTLFACASFAAAERLIVMLFLWMWRQAVVGGRVSDIGNGRDNAP